MRVLMINSVCGIRSTGRICTDLATELEKKNNEVKIAYGRENVPDKYEKYAIRIGSDMDVKIHGVKARIFDASGFGSKSATKKFIKWVEDYNPDIIHLHNLHGYYINIDILFNYLRTCGKKVIWTLHDCWPFTGHAAYCEAEECERWKSGCYKCPKKYDYPSSFLDRSRYNWKKKKELIENIQNIKIITPSNWLANLAKQSYLCQNEIIVIHNGIDLSLFKPTPSDIKKRLGIESKKIILGVSAMWEQRKGLDDFIELSKRMDSEYQIVLVGISKKQMNRLPSNIVAIKRTESVKELVELYSAAEVYVNLTYEDNYPTTNMEAIACGTPVITYDTGGSAESASLFGAVIDKGDINGIMEAIKHPEQIERNNTTLDNRQFVDSYLRIYGV